MHDLRSRVNEVSVRVRASPFGQDRYSRYYWILPNHAGVFVEGVESGGAHNAAVKYISPSTELPSPNSNGRSISDDVRTCVQDMVEAVCRSITVDSDGNLDAAYVEVKSERQSSVSEAEASAESTKAISVAKSGLSKATGGKKMKPVPFEKQQGWWFINDPEQLDAIPPHTHHRGIRERQLSRMLTKHGDFVKRTAFQAGKSKTVFLF